MNNMNNMNNLKEIIREAKDAVEILEEPLKTEAFKKILDKLLGNSYQMQSVPQEPEFLKYTNKRKRRKTGIGNSAFISSGKKMKKESDEKKKKLAEMINRTEHPQIHEFGTIILRSLYLLKIMQEKGIDGLTPPEIGHILREVFRIKARNEAISVALKDAQKYVDRDPILIGRTTAYIYKLMKPGEDYLKSEIQKNGHINEINEEEPQTLSDV